jgi:hypothetical protein
MTVISKDERNLIQKRLRAAGSPMLALIYCEAIDDQDVAWLGVTPVITIVMKMVDCLAQNAPITINVCNALVREFPTSPDNPAIKAIADRLKLRADQANADSIEELWIGSEPMVNRTALRGFLKEIKEGYDHTVVYIAGEKGSGRSHSYQLIRHVADDMEIPRYKIDFSLATEARTLQHLYGRLREFFNIDNMDEPTHEGATPGDVASKFATHLRSQLASAPHVDPKPWIVIDFSDEVPDPAVPEFLRMLCADRDANQFRNCVIFVLGTTAHLDLMRGDLFTMQVEELDRVSKSEIHEAAVALNERGKFPLVSTVLGDRSARIYDAISLLPAHERFPTLRRSLLELRREVRAP